MWYVCITYGNNVKITFSFCSSLWRIFYCVIITFPISISLRYLHFFKTIELRLILVRSNYVWKWHDKYVSLLFVVVTYFLLRRNYVIYLFNVVTFFNDVRNRFYFGTFELRTEMTIQLRFVFVSHCNVLLLHHNYVICLLDVVTFSDGVRITLYFGTFELRT